MRRQFQKYYIKIETVLIGVFTLYFHNSGRTSMFVYIFLGLFFSKPPVNIQIFLKFVCLSV